MFGDVWRAGRTGFERTGGPARRDWADPVHGERGRDRGAMSFWGATPQTPTVLAPRDAALGALVGNQHARLALLSGARGCG